MSSPSVSDLAVARFDPLKEEASEFARQLKDAAATHMLPDNLTITTSCALRSTRSSPRGAAQAQESTSTSLQRAGSPSRRCQSRRERRCLRGPTAARSTAGSSSWWTGARSGMRRSRECHPWRSKPRRLTRPARCSRVLRGLLRSCRTHPRHPPPTPMCLPSRRSASRSWQTGSQRWQRFTTRGTCCARRRWSRAH